MTLTDLLVKLSSAGVSWYSIRLYIYVYITRQDVYAQDSAKERCSETWRDLRLN